MIIVSNRYEIEILNKWGESETYVDFLIFDKQNNELAHCCNWYDGDIEPTETEILEEKIIEKDDHWCNKPISELKFSKHKLIAMIIRDSQPIIPDGKTIIREDEVVVFFTI